MSDITINIPADLEAQLEALPVKKNPVWKEWTPEMDAALLKYWPTRRHDDVAATLGVCPITALRRYRKLTGG